MLCNALSIRDESVFLIGVNFIFLMNVLNIDVGFNVDFFSIIPI